MAHGFALLAVLVLAGLPLAAWLDGCAEEAETAGQPAEPPDPRPTTEENEIRPLPDAREPGTVERFAWLEDDGDLMLFDPESGETTAVEVPDISDVHHDISWSTSGSALAYRNSSRRVTIYDLATAEQQDVGPSDLYLGQMFELSPDGTRVALVRMSKLVTWDRGTETTFEGTPRCTVPGWSADSKLVAVGGMGHDETEDAGLWLAQDGGRARLLVAPRETGWGATQRIMWSPDGKWVAWARGAGDGWSGDIARSDGSGLQRDTVGSGPLEWFPDSSALLATIHIEAGASKTGIYRLHDYSLSQIGLDHWESSAAVSPGGEMVLAWGWDGEVIVVDAQTGAETRWPEKALILQADWAPDGTIGALVKTFKGLDVWIGEASGEGKTVASTQTEVPEVARWIELPADAAVLSD